MNAAGLLWVFAKREFKERYIGSIGSLLWLIIHPLLLLAIYNFVFSVVFRIKFLDLYQADFIVFVALALWPWLMFQEGAQRASRVIITNQGLIRKSSFNRALLVYASVLATFVTHLLGFILVILIFFGLNKLEFAWINLAISLFCIGILFAVCIGFSLILAALQVYLRDVEFIQGTVFMVWFYITPILYPIALVPGSLQGWLQLNPLTTLIENIRNPLMSRALEMDGFAWIGMLAGSGLFLILAHWFFRRLAVNFEDYL